MKEINTNKAPLAIGPYSQAIVAEKIIYTSGQIPVNPITGEIPGGITAQTTQVLQNLKNLLEESGSDIEKVLKTTVFIKNMEDFSSMNEVYSKYFKKPYPARSCVEVARLPKDVLIEIEAIAEI